MKKDLNIKELNEDYGINGVIDLNEEDLEHEYFDDPKDSFPKISTHGHELYDANGNMELSEEEIKEMTHKLEEKYSEVMDILRISKNDPNSTNTPKRIANMLINELFAGRYSSPPKMTVFPNRNHVNNLVISKGIEIMSVCSHHWQPISGFCSIGYIPDKFVLGLSKLTRIVNWFSRRGQIQEELGEQIADYLEKILKPKALGVVIDAKHYCMIARGVHASEENSITTTSVMRGYLLDNLNLRNEFLKLIKE